MWTTVTGDVLEQSVPVLWHGEHLRRNGWDNPITLCFLQGLELLSAGYRSRLVELGYKIVDCSPLVADIVNFYPQCLQLSTTSRYWFLRWNVLHALTMECDAETIIHLDGDVVLLVDPRDLYRDVAGKNFMLQGCPVLTVITNRAWFTVWQEELTKLLADRKAYVATALEEKNNPHFPDRDYCNVCAYGPNRFEDQDMLEYLIAAGRLPQDRTFEVYDSAFYWIQNPLLPGEWHEEQAKGVLRQVVERDGNICIGEKRLAFYHFQGDFAKYCRMWQQFTRFGMGGGTSLLKLAGPGRRNSSLVDAAGKLIDLANRKVSRRAVYEFAFQRNTATGNLNITDIVNSCWE